MPSLGVVSPDRRIERGAFGSRGQIRRCCPHDHLVATPLLPCQATIDGRRPLGEIVSAGLSLLLFFVGRPSRNGHGHHGAATAIARTSVRNVTVDDALGDLACLHARRGLWYLDDRARTRVPGRIIREGIDGFRRRRLLHHDLSGRMNLGRTLRDQRPARRRHEDDAPRRDPEGRGVTAFPAGPHAERMGPDLTLPDFFAIPISIFDAQRKTPSTDLKSACSAPATVHRPCGAIVRVQPGAERRSRLAFARWRR